MRRHSIFAIFAATLIVLLCRAVPSAAVPISLITEEEGQLGAYTGASVVMRSVGGPEIQVLSPDQKGEEMAIVPKPVELKLLFVSNGGTRVDMATLKVTYLKLFGIDITNRLKPYVIANGIDVPEADLPTGRHSIRIDIADDKGRMTSRTFEFKVE